MKKKKNLTAFQTIILSFLGMILVGTGLLMLPISSTDRHITPFVDCLFTATSASCVTGLVVQDTATHWSSFGHAVILLLIQIGGLGVVTMAMWIALLSGRKITLSQRGFMQESISGSSMGNIFQVTLFAVKITLTAEAIGAFLLAFRFCREYGIGKGIWYAVFHSVSAFCNAGFDLMGTKSQFSSMTSYASDWFVNLVLMWLIVTGGLGFHTWSDIRRHTWHIRKYSMQSKAILAVSGILIFVPALIFLFTDFLHGTWNLGTGNSILAALFQSVTMRTAGFNTVDLAQMNGGSTTVMIFLMLIGGSPGSTAGGLKTTTLAVLVASAMSVFRKNKQTRMFGRSISDETVRNASAVLMMYLALFLTSSVVVSNLEGQPIRECLFECGSAVGTVGLSLGMTPSLGTISRIIIVMLMFIGRVGGLTLIYAAVSPKKYDVSRLPEEHITVG